MINLVLCTIALMHAPLLDDLRFNGPMANESSVEVEGLSELTDLKWSPNAQRLAIVTARGIDSRLNIYVWSRRVLRQIDVEDSMRFIEVNWLDDDRLCVSTGANSFVIDPNAYKVINEYKNVTSLLSSISGVVQVDSSTLFSDETLALSSRFTPSVFVDWIRDSVLASFDNRKRMAVALHVGSNGLSRMSRAVLIGKSWKFGSFVELEFYGLGMRRPWSCYDSVSKVDFWGIPDPAMEGNMLLESRSLQAAIPVDLNNGWRGRLRHLEHGFWMVSAHSRFVDEFGELWILGHWLSQARDEKRYLALNCSSREYWTLENCLGAIDVSSDKKWCAVATQNGEMRVTVRIGNTFMNSRVYENSPQ